MERTGILNPIEVVVIDDTLVGIEAAKKNAGVIRFSFVVVCRAHRNSLVIENN